MLILTFRMTSKNYTFLWSLKQCVDILASLTSFHAKMMELIWSSVHLSGIHLVFSRFYTSDGSCTCNPGFGSATALWVYWILLKQVILHEGLFDDFTKLWILIGNLKKEWRKFLFNLPLWIVAKRLVRPKSLSYSMLKESSNENNIFFLFFLFWIIITIQSIFVFKIRKIFSQNFKEK